MEDLEQVVAEFLYQETPQNKAELGLRKAVDVLRLFPGIGVGRLPHIRQAVRVKLRQLGWVQVNGTLEAPGEGEDS